MSKKIKAVDVIPEEPTEQVIVEEAKDKPIEDEAKQESIIEEQHQGSDKPEEPKTDEVEIVEIIKGEENPKPSRKMVKCPDCGKSMLEKNFRYQHIDVCGKIRKPKPRAKPLEEVIKEKRERTLANNKPTEPKAPEVVAPPTKPDYMELRRQYTNELKERKQQLVKKLVSKAF